MTVAKKIIASLLLGLSATPALAITNNQVFAYAEANYASLFAGTATSGQYQQYNYRYYPATGNYLAVDTSGIIYILGPVSGGKITSVGPVSAFEGAVTAWEAAQASTAASLSSSLLGTWKLMTSASSSSGGIATDVSALGMTARINASTYTVAFPGATTKTGGNYAACTETSSWTLKGNTLTTTVTDSPVSGSLCDPVGKVTTSTVAVNGNILTITSSAGFVNTYSLQLSVPSSPLSTSLLGTWKYMTSASSGSSTATDVSALGITTRIDASTLTFTLPAATTIAGSTYAACTETDSWTLNGNTLTTTATASPVSGSLCDPVGKVTTGTVEVNGNTLTVTSSTGVVNTYTLQSSANSTTPAANTTTPSTGTAPSSTGTASAGTNWSLTKISGFWIPSLRVVRYLNKQWIAAGHNSLLTLNGNLINDKITIPTTGWIYGATYGNGLYVAGGSSNTIITSPDAINWTARVSGFTNGNSRIDSVAFGNGKFVAVTSYGWLTDIQDVVQTSVDGITWSATDMTPHFSNSYKPTFNSVTFGNGQFVAVGLDASNDAGIFTSADGITWVKQNTGLPAGRNGLSLTSVKFAGGNYIAVGWSGLVLTSPDGITWTKRTAVTPSVLRDVAYGNGKYVAVGDTGTMIESNDGGVTWTALPALTTQLLNSIDFANNQFVVAGEYVLITSP